MPKYLCKDYLSEALQQRRSQLEAMLVTPPHHIEFVNQYVHRGEVQEQHLSPTHILENAVEYSDLPCISCTDCSITGNLTALVRQSTRTGCLDRELEDFKSCDDSGEGDLSLLSQDIDSAMDRFVSLSNEPAAAGVSSERFLPVKLLTEQLQVDEGYGGHCLEEMESHLHLEGLLQLMPTVKDMAARLRPKMIQDPLLDRQGRPYSYFKLCSSDFCLDATKTKGTESPELLAEEKHGSLLQERFSPDKLVQEVAGQEVDPFLELVVAEEEGEGEGEGPVGVVESALAVSDGVVTGGELEQAMDQKATTSELEMLVERCKSTAGLSTLETTPDYTPEKKQDHIDLAKLLNQGSGPDCSTDSGIGHALLESPCIPPPSSSSPPSFTSTPFLQHQLDQLEPLPLTPQGEMYILSPLSKKKQLKELWEKEKLFDTVLALTLPCPDIDGSIEELLTLEDTIAKLTIKPLKFDGDNELELSWDPLDASYQSMSVASKSLLSSQPLFDEHGPSPSSGEGQWREEFVGDTCGSGGDGKESPLSPVGSDVTREVDGGSESEQSALHSDVPDLCLQPDVPVGYLRPHPLPNKSDAQGLSSTPPTSVSFFGATTGLDPWGVVQQAGARNRESGRKQCGQQLYSFRVSPQSAIKCKAAPSMSPLGDVSALDAFLMLRTEAAGNSMTLGGRKRARPHSPQQQTQTDKRPALLGTGDAVEQEMIEKKTSPFFQDVCLSGDYLAALSKMESLLMSLRGQLEGCGLHLPLKGSWPRDMSVDSLKFFMKQQQKALQDKHGLEQDGGDGLRSCQLAACLYVTGSVLDAYTHCSLKTALSHFSCLLERYSHLLRDMVASLKTLLLKLETDRSFPPHPKLAELVRVVSVWKKERRRSSRDKVVVVVAREFSVLSGEILDYLQSISGLESCVFSLTSCEASNDLYKSAVEERFHHYDCLVVPLLALSDHSCFLWEKVSLLVEYEALKTPLFGGSEQKGDLEVWERLHLQQYVTLRTVLDLSTSNISFSTACDSVSYTVLASESVTSNSQLLQLLETRYNVLIVERDYSSLTPSKWLSWADISISPGVGILLRPFSTLASSTGGSGLIHTVTGLSLQYQTCWVILYRQDPNCYELGGCVPDQLSLLHASVCSLHAHFQVQVLLASSTAHVAQLIRRITEETQRVAKDEIVWEDRSWLSEEMTKKERLLLSFPCINSFSAQFMLHRFTLSELLSADLDLLRERLPDLPERVLKLFHGMSHVNAVVATGHTESPSLPDQAQHSPLVITSESLKPSHYQFIDLTTSPVGDSYYSDQVSDPVYTIHESNEMSDDMMPHRYGVSGLNDSLEFMDSASTEAHSTDIIDLATSSSSDNTQTMFHGDLESWVRPALGQEDFQFSTGDRGFMSSKSTFSQAMHPAHKEQFWRQMSPSPLPSADQIPGPVNPPDFNLRCDPTVLQRSPNNRSSSIFPSNLPFGDKTTSSRIPPAIPSAKFTECDLPTNSAAPYINPPIGTSLKLPHHRPPASIDNSLSRFPDHTIPPTNANRGTTPRFSIGASLLSHPSTKPLSSGVPSTNLDEFLSEVPRPSLLDQHSLLGNQPLQKCKAESTSINSYLNGCPQNAPPVSSSGLFDDGLLVPRSSKAISSLVVRKPRQLPSHKPVKALDLGLDCDRDRNVKLRSNDRVLATSSAATLLGGTSHVRRSRELDQTCGEVMRIKYFPVTSAGSGRVASSSRVSNVGNMAAGTGSGGVVDLKAFHQHESARSLLPASIQQREI